MTIPTEATVAGVASVVGYITEGLDAVVLGRPVASIKHPGCMTFTVTGNPRDLKIAEERSEKLGRVE